MLLLFFSGGLGRSSATRENAAMDSEELSSLLRRNHRVFQESKSLQQPGKSPTSRTSPRVFIRQQLQVKEVSSNLDRIWMLQGKPKGEPQFLSILWFFREMLDTERPRFSHDPANTGGGGVKKRPSKNAQELSDPRAGAKPQAELP